MSLPENKIKAYLINHPFNAFSLICRHNKELNVLKQEDAQKYLEKHDSLARSKIMLAIATSTLLGVSSCRLIPGQGILKGISVTFIAISGVFLGTQMAAFLNANSAKIMVETIEKYNKW